MPQAKRTNLHTSLSLTLATFETWNENRDSDRAPKSLANDTTKILTPSSTMAGQKLQTLEKTPTSHHQNYIIVTPHRRFRRHQSASS